MMAVYTKGDGKMFEKVINLQEFDFAEFKKEFKGYEILDKIEKAGLEYEFLDLLRAYFNYNNILDIMDVCDFLEYEEEYIISELGLQ